MRARCLRLLAFSVLVSTSPGAASAAPAAAETTPQPSLAEMSLDEINQQLENPLSRLWSLTLQENFSINQGDRVNGSARSNNFFFQPFMPVPIGERWMLTLRPVFPLVTNNIFHPENEDQLGRETGFGDIQILALMGPDRSDGLVYGLGVSTRFPSATSDALGQGKYQAGPAGMLFYMRRPWTLGLLVQHWESFAGDPDRKDVSRTDMQYVIRFALPRAWSVGMGPTITVDWKASEGNKLTLPIGLGLTKTVRIGQMPVKLRLEPQYSLVRPDDFGTTWNIRVQVTPVVPNPLKRR